MGLNMADFGKSGKSLQTLWNASKTVLKWFVTACATVCVDLGWIRKGRKLADFEQKAWAISHGFERGGFWQVLEIAPKSLKRLLKTLEKFFVTTCANVFVDFNCIGKGRKLVEDLGIAHSTIFDIVMENKACRNYQERRSILAPAERSDEKKFKVPNVCVLPSMQRRSRSSYEPETSSQNQGLRRGYFLEIVSLALQRNTRCDPKLNIRGGYTFKKRGFSPSGIY